MDDTDALADLTNGVVAVDLDGAEVVRVGGADRLTFLQRLVTGNIAGTPPGRGCHSLLLTIKGHIVSEFRALVRSDDVRLVVVRGQGAPTAAALGRYAIMDDVSATADGAMQLSGLFGPRAIQTLATAGVAVPDGFASQPLWSHVDVGASSPLWLVRARGFGADGVWVGGERADLAALQARLATAGVRRLRPAVAEALRIDAGEPRFGAEITDQYFPMELGLSSAIDYSKGCYLGQEPIVRVRDRGHLNRRLVRLTLLAAGDAAPGDLLEDDARPKAGHVTSVARLPDGPGVALAMLHVSVPAGSQVRVRHGETVLVADVRELPPQAVDG